MIFKQLKNTLELLKTLVNARKTPLKPLIVGNKLVTDLLINADLFNEYFSEKNRTIDNQQFYLSKCNF